MMNIVVFLTCFFVSVAIGLIFLLIGGVNQLIFGLEQAYNWPDIIWSIVKLFFSPVVIITPWQIYFFYRVKANL